MNCSPRMPLAHLSFFVFSIVLSISAQAQTASTNINMVSGTQWPNGDPFLQRQDEPSLSVSTRNPLHLLAGANDYRTVDLPGTTEGKVTGDAWLGVFKSRDGGLRWQSTLLPGYPQDSSPAGLASPLKGLTAAADPIVRAGTNGLFYFGGIAFNRDDDNAPNKLFVARFIDKNNRENGDVIRYINTVAIQTTSSGDFADKPWLVTDIPRGNAPNCSVDGETFRGGNVYVAWTLFTNGETQGKIMFSRSTNCGASWSAPKVLSTGQTLSQGATIAVNPLNGNIYVAWRRFLSGTQSDAMFVVRSTNSGSSFSNPVQVASLPANNFFEQGTTNFSFRTNSYPTMTIDLLGRAYLAWSQRGVGPGGDARVMLATSPDGTTWTTPRAADNHSGRGHQIMPTISMSALKLMLEYYDIRETSTIGIYQRAESGQMVETREPLGDLIESLTSPKVFNNFIMDALPLPSTEKIKRRHTMDVRFVQANPAANPVFTPSVRVTKYDYGSKPGSNVIEQLEFNPPNLPMFKRGTAAFFGDYIDIATSLVSPTLSGSWTFGDLSLAGGAHVVWTDNRNVQPPPPGKTWADYTPPISVFAPAGSASIFDPTQTRPTCEPSAPGYSTAGMRNQNIYTSRITQGLYVGILGNNKPLSSLQRAFALFAQNNLDTTKHYRLTITNQPTGGIASFLPTGATRSTLDVSIAPFSSVARSIFVTSTDAKARVLVLVQQITAPGGSLVSGGMQSGVMLNPDAANPSLIEPENPTPGNPSIATAEVYNVTITAPEIRNPEIANPEIANPEIANPEIANPEIANPEIANPEIANPEIANPEIANPEIANPEIANPEIANPEIANPEIANPEIANGSMTDASWTITNTGNTSATYNVKLVSDTPVPTDMKFQLLVYWTYTTPVAKDCTLTQETNYILQTNIINPEFLLGTANLINQTQDITNGSIQNVTIALEPGQSAKITLRAVGSSKEQVVNYLTSNVQPAAVAQAANTGTSTPSASIAPLGVATSILPAGVTGGAYSTNLLASGGTTPYSWSIASGSLPTGLSLSSTGIISGTPTAAGLSTFTVRVSDAAAQTATRTVSIQVKATATASLSFIAQPANAAVNQPIPPATGVRVLALQGGNPVPGLNITMTIGNNPGSGSLIGIATIVTDANGIATFPNLSINAAGVGYTLVASASGTAQITSNAFNVNVPASTILSFFVQPRSLIATIPGPNIEVQAVDGFGSVIPFLNVTLSLASNPSGATLSGTLSATTDGTGIAQFPGVALNRAGYGYVLQATSAGGGNAFSAAFHVEGFLSAPALNIPRAEHRTILLPSGEAFLTGGFTTGGVVTATTELRGTGGSAAGGNLVNGRGDHRATLLPDGRVLITGGWSGSATLQSAELYSPGPGGNYAAGSSSLTGNMVIARTLHTETLLPNGKVLIYGGQNDTGLIALAGQGEIYDPATGSFISFSGAVARSSHTATLLANGKVLIAGGYTTGGLPVATAEIFDPTTNTITPTGSMNVARAIHTATRLPDGRVLITGGEGTSAPSLTSIEIYNPASGTFSSAGNLSVPVLWNSATLLPNGSVLIAGGDDRAGTVTAAGHIFNPEDDSLRLTQAMGAGRAYHTATLMPNGTVLMAGSYDGAATVSASAEVFYPIAPPFQFDIFLPTGGMNTARTNFASATLSNGKIMIAGGSDSEGVVLNSAEVFDPVFGAFSITGNLITARRIHAITSLPDGRALVSGGSGSGGFLSSAELYSPVTGTFTATGVMTATRSGHSSVLLSNGKVLITGGQNFGYLSSAELYDPATGTFTATGNMTVPRQFQASILLSNGKVLIIGGINGTGTLLSAELYDPNTGTFSSTGSMSIARTFNPVRSFTLLANGKVLVAGSGSTTAEIYDPVTGAFSVAGSSATPCGALTLLSNGKVLATCAAATAAIFDPATNTFSPTGSMSIPRSGGHQHRLYTGHVIVIGGGGFSSGNRSAELYHPGQ